MNRQVHHEEGVRDRHENVPTVRLADTTDAAGLAVTAAMFEAEIAEACGPKGKHDAERAAVRHGAGRGSVTLGGRQGRGEPAAGAYPG